MSKRCQFKKAYYKEFGNYKGKGKYTDDYVKWLENIIINHDSELKKLRVDDVSVCACGSTKYYSEQYKDVTKYFCSNCHEKIKSKH